MTSLRWGDLATKAHAYTGTGMPELIGAQDTGIPNVDNPRTSAAYTYRLEHDYGYGLSNPRLRPDVPDEGEDTPGRLGPKPRRKPRNDKGRKRGPYKPRVVIGEPGEPIESAYPPAYPVAEPVIMPSPPARRIHTRRYTVSHPVIERVSRNDYSVETMLADLLDGSQ